MRGYFSKIYLTGEGIEIGPLNNPLIVPLKVKYVDRKTAEELKEEFSYLQNIRDVDIIAEAETLTPIPDNSFDFVISNHVIEHLANPLLSIENMFRVVKPNGILFITVPDMTTTFDKDRAITSVNHIFNDYKGKDTLKEHYAEWYSIVEPKRVVGDFDSFVSEQIAKETSIHIHTFIEYTVYSLFHRFIIENKTGKIEMIARHNAPEFVEYICVLRKLDK